MAPLFKSFQGGINRILHVLHEVMQVPIHLNEDLGKILKNEDENLVLIDHKPTLRPPWEVE